MLGPQTASAQSYITQWSTCGDDISVSATGEVLVLVGGGQLIHRYAKDSVFLGDFGTEPNARSIATDAQGNIFVLCKFHAIDSMDIQKLASIGSRVQILVSSAMS
jgi:hypothetical protein